jgi:hypothetical protein
VEVREKMGATALIFFSWVVCVRILYFFSKSKARMDTMCL